MDEIGRYHIIGRWHMREPKIYLKLALNLIIWVVSILLLIFVLPKILRFFMPFVIGWIIAVIANPLVKFMEKRIKIVRKHSSAIIIIGVLAAVIGILYFAITTLGGQVIQLINDLPNIYETMEAQIQLAADKLQGVYKMLPGNGQLMVDEIMDGINEYAINFVHNLRTPGIDDAGVFAKSVAEAILMFGVTVLSSYFFIAERDNLLEVIQNITPKSVAKNYRLIMDNFKMALGGYIKAQFKIMLILVAIMFVGFEILGIGYSFLIAFGIAFLDFLPVFGTGAVLWPWALVDMLTGNYWRAIVLMVIYLICQVIKQVLQPKMVGDSIGLSPLMTLFFMYIGYRLKGILGMIFGIPIGMVIINLYKAGIFNGLINEVKIIVEDINKFRKLK